MKFGKRVLFFLHWLVSIAIVLALTVLKAQANQLTALLQESIGERYTHIAFIAVLVLYAILSIVCLLMIFKRDSKRGERGFITMDSSDNGRVRIAVSAVEQMVRHAIEKVDGIAETKITITNRDDALNVTVKAVLAGGAHVPTVTMNIQRAIRQYVEMNCGVAVCAVSVNVQSISTTVEVPQASVAPEAEKPTVPTFELHPTVPETVETMETPAAPVETVEPMEAPVMPVEAERMDTLSEETSQTEEEAVEEAEENEQ